MNSRAMRSGSTWRLPLGADDFGKIFEVRVERRWLSCGDVGRLVATFETANYYITLMH